MNYKSKSLLAAERIIRELKEQDGNITNNWLPKVLII